MTGVAGGSVTGRDPAAGDHLAPKNGPWLSVPRSAGGRLLCEVHVQVYERDTVPYVQFPADSFLDVDTIPARSRRSSARPRVPGQLTVVPRLELAPDCQSVDLIRVSSRRRRGETSLPRCSRWWPGVRSGCCGKRCCQRCCLVRTGCDARRVSRLADLDEGSQQRCSRWAPGTPNRRSSTRRITQLTFRPCSSAYPTTSAAPRRKEPWRTP